ncbi:MAG: Imm50 family immunity protein [Blastocatellales bacterium]
MWYQLCENPRAITERYKAEPADTPVVIHEVRLHEDGPLVQLKIDLPVFPEKPHPRWPVGANTLQVELNFWGVSAFEQTGWGTDNVGILTLVRDETLCFSFASNSSKFSGSCISAHINKVTAYIDGSKETA